MKFFCCLVLLSLFACSTSENVSEPNEVIWKSTVDSLLINSDFNGVILIQKDDKTIYSNTKGFSNFDAKTKLKLSDQFVIGSISKQITTVLVMRAKEKGKIDLNQTIDKYLPELLQPWAKEVTIHHLLTHTHGIVSEDAPLEFKPGSQFSYSQLGYELLAQVLENVEQQSFQELSTSLFRENGLNDTFHPDDESYIRLVKGYETLENGTVSVALNSLKNYVAAGSFISTASDLSKWNYLLHSGKLVKKPTYELMQMDHATRIHPIFDSIQYGYGLVFKKGQNAIEIGTFGYAPGFVSTSYFYPKSKISLVVLSNLANDPSDFKKIFWIHTELMKIMKKSN